MSARDINRNIHSTSEQVQFGRGQFQSGHERAQSHGQVHFGSGQSQSSIGQSSSTDEAIQMLLNKNKIEVENKQIDKEEQMREAEKGMESIRRFNQINEEIKKSYDEYAAKTKHREKNMRESLLKAEAKYLKDEDRESSRDGESTRDGDKSSDSDSSDEHFHSKMPKTNSSKIRCEE